MPTDIGEYIVGAYLQIINECDFVHYNTRFHGEQGDIDVIGLRLHQGNRRTAYLCEVKTHLGGLSGSRGKEAEKLSAQIRAAQRYASTTLKGWTCVFQIWSPKVGRTTEQRIRDDVGKGGPGLPKELEFVFNDEYRKKIEELANSARHNDRSVENPAFRLLQILTRTGSLQL